MESRLDFLIQSRNMSQKIKSEIKEEPEENSSGSDEAEGDSDVEEPKVFIDYDQDDAILDEGDEFPSTSGRSNVLVGVISIYLNHF